MGKGWGKCARYQGVGREGSFDALESDDSDDEEEDEDSSTPALLCFITPSPILADSGTTHVLLRESVLPSLTHFMRPATLGVGGTIVGRSGNVVWGRGDVALKVVKRLTRTVGREVGSLLSRVGCGAEGQPGGWEGPDY